MSARIYVHEFEKPDIDLGADAIIAFEREDGARVRVSFDAEGEVYVMNDDGRLTVEARATNALVLKPTSRATVSVARRVRKAINAGEVLMIDDLRTLVEAVLR